jgi:aspartate kinase
VTDPGPAVYKFGGTSLATGDFMSRAGRLVDEAGGVPVVVVSALAGVTSELERLAVETDALGREEALEALALRHREVARTALDPSGDSALDEEMGTVLERLATTLSAATTHSGTGEVDHSGADPYRDGRRDAVVACGEDLSAAIMAAVLRARGRDARVVDARTVVRTDARFGRAVPEDETTVRLAWERLGPLLSRGTIPVLQGFVGADARGRTTTLGRGGSDFTAAIVGAALGSPEVTIWTDVDGIFSADPNQVPGARVLKELGYEEAVELAYFGAKVIHPAAAKHAVGRQVALRVRNTFHPERPGTLVRTDQRGAPGVAALAHKAGTALIRVRSRPLFMAYGFLSRVFDALARHRVPVDLVATSHTSTAFTVDRSAELDAVRRSLEEFAEVEVVDRLATVSAIGRGLLEAPGVAGQIFAVLGDVPIQLISQATDTSLSFLVAEAEAPGIVARLHETLIENGEAGE